MILHLHTDSRFADYTIDLFDAEQNVHLVGKRFPRMKLNSINKSNLNRIHHYVFGWSSARKLIRRFDPKLVVIHFLDLRWAEFIFKLPDDVRIVWIFWGADGYRLPKMRERLYDPITKKYQRGHKDSGISKLKAELNVSSVLNLRFILSLGFEVLRNIRSRSSSFILDRLFERLDYCGTFLKEDYELLQRNYSFGMKWVDARFVSLEKLLGEMSDDFIHGQNLLLGNSCTLENNHLDAISQMDEINFKSNDRVICPLNYGKDLGAYQQAVVSQGVTSFGSRFEPLLTPLNLSDYTQVLKSCAYAIMFHNRQQAFNNILALVYLGVKVYLKPENTIYLFLKRIGCIVFSTDELGRTGRLIPLSKEEQKANRAVVEREFSLKRIASSANEIEKLIHV